MRRSHLNTPAITRSHHSLQRPEGAGKSDCDPSPDGVPWGCAPGVRLVLLEFERKTDAGQGESNTWDF